MKTQFTSYSYSLNVEYPLPVPHRLSPLTVNKKNCYKITDATVQLIFFSWMLLCNVHRKSRLTTHDCSRRLRMARRPMKYVWLRLNLEVRGALFSSMITPNHVIVCSRQFTGNSVIQFIHIVSLSDNIL